MNNIGLVLSGGGARTAFQIGVLKAISEWVSSQNIPFNVVSGVSAGSINATYLAANANQFKYAIENLEEMWRSLHTKYIYNSSIISDNRMISAFKLFNAMRTESSGKNSMLDAGPLARLLSDRISFQKIQKCLDEGSLHSLAITATNYHESMTTTFVQSNQDYDWIRAKRSGIKQKIKIKHILASAAIPFLFAPVKIKKQFYGDGSLRNFAPFSSAIRCGAKKLVVIGIRDKEHMKETGNESHIGFGDIFSKILNTILVDSIEIDYERLSRINNTIHQTKSGGASNLKHIDTVIVKPSICFTELVKEFKYETPPVLSQLLSIIGSKKNTSDLSSYLLFEPGYIGALIDQGYNDAYLNKENLLDIINKKALE